MPLKWPHAKLLSTHCSKSSRIIFSNVVCSRYHLQDMLICLKSLEVQLTRYHCHRIFCKVKHNSKKSIIHDFLMYLNSTMEFVEGIIASSRNTIPRIVGIYYNRIIIKCDLFVVKCSQLCHMQIVEYEIV